MGGNFGHAFFSKYSAFIFNFVSTRVCEWVYEYRCPQKLQASNPSCELPDVSEN